MLKPTSIAALAVLTMSSLAFAQPAQVDDLDAERISPTEVRVDFEFDGGACQSVEPAQLGEIVDGLLTVTFPTVSTAEMCTMQVVEIEVEQVIAADESVSRIEVIVLGTDGEPSATGSTNVERD